MLLCSRQDNVTGLSCFWEPARPQLNISSESLSFEGVHPGVVLADAQDTSSVGGFGVMATLRIYFADSRKRYWGRVRPGIVYLMRRSDGKFKIGCVSGNVEWRRDTLSAGCGDLKILHTFPAKDRYTAERLLHRYLHRLRIKGEWYALPNDVVDWIKRIEGFIGEDPFQECDCGLLVREADA